MPEDLPEFAPDGMLINYLQPPNPFDEGGTIGLSLSGGGYRATTFATGALVALHDGGVWSTIRWIASVSGGSFANAAAAVALPEHPSTADLNGFVGIVARTVRRPLSLAWWPARRQRSRYATLAANIYEAGIRRSWTDFGRRSAAEPRSLASLARPDRVHAFMSADLATSAPVVLADRLVMSNGLAEDWQTAYRPGPLPLSSAVRASATFPGLPAVRVGPADLGEELEWTVHDMFLVDGGAWDNLGTEWERWARWFDRDYVLPKTIPRHVDWHVVVDASAPPKRPKFRHGTERTVGWDWPLWPAKATFETSNHSIVAAARGRLRDAQQRGAPIIVVELDEVPSSITRRSAFAFSGGDEEFWRGIADQNRAINTVGKTALGLDRDEVKNLLAHSYVQLAAYLTNIGVPYDRFSDPWKRFKGLV